MSDPIRFKAVKTGSDSFSLVSFGQKRGSPASYLAIDEKTGDVVMQDHVFLWGLTRKSNMHWKISSRKDQFNSQLTTELPAEVGCPVIVGQGGAEWEFVAPE